MPRSTTQRQVRKQINRMGHPVQLVLLSQVEDTSRGRGWVVEPDMPVEITGVVDYGGDSLGYDLFGATGDASIVLYVRDDVVADHAEPIRDVEEGGDNGATRFLVDGDPFKVDTKNQYEQYGALVLELEETESVDLPESPEVT